MKSIVVEGTKILESFIFEIDSFDIFDLKVLRDVLENYQIYKFKEIHNGIKSENKIEIICNKKRIKLNEKFNFKVKLIRNKYHRQLLNLINIIGDINKTLGKYNSAVEEYNSAIDVYSTNKAQFSFLDDLDDLDNLWKIDTNNYKDILKMALINYIGVYNFDNIFELTKDEMLKLNKYRQESNSNNNNNNSNIDDILENSINLFGMYCHTNEKLLGLLETSIDRSELEGCNTFILICPELINEFCSENLDTFKEYGISTQKELYTIILNKVLVHEIGHGVFDYIDDFENESRANYFASLTFDGTFDLIIKKLTDIQGGLYKDPKLITDDIETIKKVVYNI